MNIATPLRSPPPSDSDSDSSSSTSVPTILNKIPSQHRSFVLERLIEYTDPSQPPLTDHELVSQIKDDLVSTHAGEFTGEAIRKIFYGLTSTKKLVDSHQKENEEKVREYQDKVQDKENRVTSTRTRHSARTVLAEIGNIEPPAVHEISAEQQQRVQAQKCWEIVVKYTKEKKEKEKAEKQAQAVQVRGTRKHRQRKNSSSSSSSSGKDESDQENSHSSSSSSSSSSIVVEDPKHPQNVVERKRMYKQIGECVRNHYNFSSHVAQLNVSLMEKMIDYLDWHKNKRNNILPTSQPDIDDLLYN